MIGFAIYDLPVGGGVLGISPLPGRTRHYATDFEHLMGWRPDMVITMVTLPELARKGSGTLGMDLDAEGVIWRHLPVEDFGAPGVDVQVDWPEVSETARQVLGKGGKVLAHCFGGCGRSGMVCLRLMIEAGEVDALARLRAVRPCAVETEDQMAWALAGAE